jgi:tetratricopeptide (TPR) repeat protein
MSEESKHKKPGDQQQERPPQLVPPDAESAGEAKPSRIMPMVIVGAGLLLAALALLVIFLPIGSDTRSVKAPAAAPEAPAATAKPSQQEAPVPDSGAREEVEALIGDWLREQAEAEAQGIAAWGGEAYAGAVALTEECERLLGKQEYLQARESCVKAIAELDQLMTAKPALLEQALLAGTRALDNGESEAAAELFRTALAIDADNEQALAGIRRAENLPQVLQFVKDGSELEVSGDTEGALLAFQAAVNLDPAYPPAREALNRVEASVADRAFRQAMSQALQALSAGRLSAAGKALKQAGAIKSGDPAVSDLKQQLESRRLAVQLDNLRQEAARLEQTERWPDALKSCEKALALDARAAFATACKERVSQRIDLDKQLQGFLNRPERRFEDAPLEAARQLLAFARNIEPSGPRLAGQVKRLAALITEAEAEVEVLIKSDGLTEISIYHVGRLGHFLEKRLLLRTGDYTATGSRNGYRDTRQTFKVRPGSGALVFTMRCEEPI